MQGLFGRVSKGVCRKIFRLLVASCMITFLSVWLLMFFESTVLQEALFQKGKDVAVATGEYAEEARKQHIQHHLVELSVERAFFLETLFEDIGKSVEDLAAETSFLLRNSESLPSRSLPTPYYQSIRSGEAYVLYGTELRGREKDERISQEISKISNIAERLEWMADNRYAEDSLLIASRNGYMICVNNLRDGGDVVLSEDFLGSYNPSQRPWYLAAQGAVNPVFGDIRVAADAGVLCFSCSMPYEDADGFAGVVSIRFTLADISQEVDEYTGKTGVDVVLNSSGEVISSRHEGILKEGKDGVDLRTIDNKELAQAAVLMTKGQSGIQSIEIEGTKYYLAFAPITDLNWSYGMLVEQNEVIEEAKDVEKNVLEKFSVLDSERELLLKRLTIASFFLFFLMVFFVLLASSLFAKRITNPLLELESGVKEISEGNLDRRLDIHTGDELEHLADCINSMNENLKMYMENLTRAVGEKERIATELSVAANIQNSMLPTDFPQDPLQSSFDLYASVKAAKDVGGDFYDFYQLDENHVVVTVADVSGKGIGAALFMVVAKTILKNFALTMGGADDLVPMVTCTNEQLCKNNDALMFVTAFVGMLELSTGRFTYVSAGHTTPAVYRSSEACFSYLSVRNSFVLGGMEGVRYKGAETFLAPGDRLFLYTDGVTEAFSETQELYGEKRLLECLNCAAMKNLTLKELLEAVQESLDCHVGTAEQSDDITMLALTYTGKKRETDK